MVGSGETFPPYAILELDDENGVDKTFREVREGIGRLVVRRISPFATSTDCTSGAAGVRWILVRCPARGLRDRGLHHCYSNGWMILSVQSALLPAKRFLDSDQSQPTAILAEEFVAGFPWSEHAGFFGLLRNLAKVHRA